ncbi:unnamed protein product [Rhizophagus irregularis]|uniref:MATA-HMG n=1 Tax=Rhizophagus irregularis TaxID=588596 RepID=A0A1B1EV87_9GLOM|nr:MATA-HMG [Rhizophagus irregularis]CAB4434416.1 unnamed protein product [Rhizophagus irregularis]
MSKNRAVKRKAYELQGNYRVFSLYENASIDMNPCKSPANKTIHFVGDTCDNCDGMVNNLTLDAELLSENSDKTRKAISNKKKGIVKVPRPPNAFIIYRREKKAKHNDVFCKRTEADISKEVGKMWQNEPEDIKDMYYRLAEHAKKKHLEKYSGYRYQPERGKKKDSRKEDESIETIIESNHEESPPNSDLNPNPDITTNDNAEPIPESITHNHDIHLANYSYYLY